MKGFRRVRAPTRRQVEALIAIGRLGEVTATRFAAAMGYKGGSRRRQAAASVLVRLRRRGWAYMYLDCRVRPYVERWRLKEAEAFAARAVETGLGDPLENLRPGAGSFG